MRCVEKRREQERERGGGTFTYIDVTPPPALPAAEIYGAVTFAVVARTRAKELNEKLKQPGGGGG